MRVMQDVDLAISLPVDMVSMTGAYSHEPQGCEENGHILKSKAEIGDTHGGMGSRPHLKDII